MREMCVFDQHGSANETPLKHKFTLKKKRLHVKLIKKPFMCIIEMIC